MKGNQPRFTDHIELHAGAVRAVRAKGLDVGVPLDRRGFNAYIMQNALVGNRQSVNRYLEAWEDLGLVEWKKGNRADPGSVTLLERPEGLEGPPLRNA